MKRTKKNIVILCCSLAMICAITFSVRVINFIDISGLKIIIRVAINLLNGLIAWIAVKQTGMIVKIDFKNKRQYLIGFVLGFSKYKIKDCGYVGVAFGHGLYDFLNTLVRMFIV